MINIKKNYIKYGNTSGKKYATRTKFGKWDQEFTIEKLDEFVEIFYKKLKKRRYLHNLL